MVFMALCTNHCRSQVGVSEVDQGFLTEEKLVVRILPSPGFATNPFPIYSSMEIQVDWYNKHEDHLRKCYGVSGFVEFSDVSNKDLWIPYEVKLWW